MKRVTLAVFGSVFTWAALVTWLTNVYFGGNMFLGALIAILGGTAIGSGVAFVLVRRVLKKPGG